MFNPTEEDRLDIFECLVFPNLYHDRQPYEMAYPLSCAQIFQRARNFRCPGLANNMGEEGIQVSRRSFMCQLCDTFTTIRIVHANENDSHQYPLQNCLFS
jgi:hypothetical protein